MYKQNYAKLLFTLVFLFFVVSAGVKGQSADTSMIPKLSEVKTGLAGRKISLEPGERKGKIEIADSCLTLLTDYKMSFTLPLGKTFETVLTAGTKLFLPKGVYNLENLTNQPVSFLLNEGSGCNITQPES